jgi:hypothetical protein
MVGGKIHMYGHYWAGRFTVYIDILVKRENKSEKKKDSAAGRQRDGGGEIAN